MDKVEQEQPKASEEEARRLVEKDRGDFKRVCQRYARMRSRARP